MASRASSVSSISGVSSIDRTVDSEGLLHTPAATDSTSEAEQPRVDQRAAADQVNKTVTTELLLQRKDSSQHEEQIADSEIKGPVQTRRMQCVRRSWYHDWWFWEIAGAFLSLGSTVAIVVTLVVCDHQPVPVLRYGITLNTMMSMLSAIAKTSMLLAATASIGQAKWLLFRKEGRNLIDFNTIDEASRGPWGAFQLLYRFRDGRTILASAGAFIILASLAVDPFTQQSLSYPSVSNVTSGYEQPIFPQVSSWNKPGNVSFWGPENITFTLPLPFRAAIYNSLLGLGTANSTLNINCPTGNCTFDRSDTLGFCSTCGDVTADVTKECNPIPPTDNTNGTHCNYTLPGGVSMYTRDKENRHEKSSITTNMSVVALHRYETLYNNNFSVIENSGDPDNTTSAPKEAMFQNVILGFGRIVFNGSNNPMSAIGGNVKPAAIECALYWCVQTLNTSIQNGVLNQTIVGTWSNKSALDTPDVYLRPNLTSNAGGNGEANGYYVSPMSNAPLVKFLQDTFNATVKGTELKDQELLDFPTYSSGIPQALWYAEDLDSLMANLADRMTDVLRNLYSDPPSDADNLGKVYTTRTYVQVTWPWLILPVGLVLASCTVLFAAIISSSRHQTIVWKSSSLAVLFHGLAGGEGRSGHSVYRKQMEQTAEEMTVQLAEVTIGDLRLVEVKQQCNKASS